MVNRAMFVPENSEVEQKLEPLLSQTMSYN